MKILRKYHDLYAPSNILLLHDVFENFRDERIDKCKLDPALFYASPQLAWIAALEMTKIEMKLLTYIELKI